MKQTLFILTLIILTGCSPETYNRIPCECNFAALQDSLIKYGLRSHGESPDGFVWKEKYDPSKVNCSVWNVTLGIDTCYKIFFDEKFVLNMADIIFSDSTNQSIQTIKFVLNQCYMQKGQNKLFYEITKNMDVNIEFSKLYETTNSKIIQQISEGYVDNPENKIVTLLLDSLPTDPYSIAQEFLSKNKEYVYIDLVVENINSQICKRVEYLYEFEK